jgi:hypothetical protein
LLPTVNAASIGSTFGPPHGYWLIVLSDRDGVPAADQVAKPLNVTALT